MAAVGWSCTVRLVGGQPCCAHQNDSGMRRPLPQLALVHVTWSSSVFWRHLRCGGSVAARVETQAASMAPLRMHAGGRPFVWLRLSLGCAQHMAQARTSGM